MRRLIVEISVRDFNQLDPEDPDLLQDVKSMEVLHFLRSDHQEVALIARVEFNKPDVSIEDVFPDDVVEVQILEHEKEEGGTKSTPISSRPNQHKPSAMGLISQQLEGTSLCRLR